MCDRFFGVFCTTSLALYVAAVCFTGCSGPTTSVGSASAGDMALSRAGVVDVSGLPDHAAAAIDDILRDVVEARGLYPRSPISARGVNREEQVAFVKTQAEDPVTMRSLRTLEALLKGVGAIRDDVDLFAVVSEFMVDDIAGYYDWDQQVLFVIDSIPVDTYPAVLAHELTHALQDQHFGLARLAEPIEGISEPFTAGLAVVEGDAMVAMTAVAADVDLVYDMRVFNAVASFLDTEWDNGAAEKGKTLPLIVSGLLKFSYVEGIRYVGSLLSAEGGKWAAVDAVLRTPPLSSEQVMHPAAPGRADNPQNVRLAVNMIPGATFQGTDIVGEAGFQAIFRDVMPRADADSAAAGWDGDRFAVFGLRDGRTVVVVVSVWDSPAEASEAGMAISRLRKVPAGLVVSGDAVAAVWGMEVDAARQLAQSLVGNIDSVEIHTWDDWLREGKLLEGAVSKLVPRFR